MFQASGEIWVRGLSQWRGAVGLSRLGGKCESAPRNAGGYVAGNTRLMYRHSVRKGFRVDVYGFTHRHDLSIVD